MFGKAKKRAVTPRASEYEKATVDQRLREKYPKMMNKTGAWGGPKKKPTAVAKIKQARKDQDDSLRGALSPAEYKRLMGD